MNVNFNFNFSVCKIAKHKSDTSYGGEGRGRASLCPAPNVRQTPVKFPDFEGLNLRWFSTNDFKTWQFYEF